MRSRSFIIIVLLSLVLWTFGCSQGPAPDTDDERSPSALQTDQGPSTEPVAGDPVATVNGRPISREIYDDAVRDLVASYQDAFAQMGQDVHEFLSGAEGRLRELQLEAGALERLLIIELFEQEATRRDITIAPERVDALFNDQFAAYLESLSINEEQYAASLARGGRTLEDFVEDGKRGARLQLMMEEVQAAVAGPVETTDGQVAEYFATHRDDYSVEERIRASHILAATRQEAQEVLEDLVAGGRFADVAQARSTDTGNADRGGDLGWFGRGELMDAAFDDAAFALDVGHLSRVVETRFGFHLILVTDRQEAARPELADIEQQVRADTERALAIERGATWRDEAYADASIVVFLPLVDAQLKLWKSEDLGLETLKTLFDEDELDEPYLGYVLGSVYESKMRETSGSGDLAAAEAARQDALAAYRAALEEVGEDVDIEQRIRILEATRIP
ncbi:peptidylprolyl isomerase [Candidatus Bipolaricaulota bacterium]